MKGNLSILLFLLAHTGCGWTELNRSRGSESNPSPIEKVCSYNLSSAVGVYTSHSATKKYAPSIMHFDPQGGIHYFEQSASDSSIRYNASVDDGLTWSRKDLDTGIYPGFIPTQLNFLDSGKVHVLGIANSGGYWALSGELDVSSDPVTINYLDAFQKVAGKSTYADSSVTNSKGELITFNHADNLSNKAYVYIRKSIDGGKNFTFVDELRDDPDTPDDNVQVRVHATAVRGTTIFASAYGTAGFQYNFLSVDDGQTWSYKLPAGQVCV